MNQRILYHPQLGLTRRILLAVPALCLMLAPLAARAADGEPSLTEQLEAANESFRARSPATMLQSIDAAVAHVAASGIVAKAIKQGDRAPDFELPDATGKRVRLSALLARGPVILTWYRGNWCPYCNLQLREYQKALDAVHAAGAELVAVSPVTPDNSLDMAQKNDLKFPVLSDLGNQVARQYGVVYKVPAEIRSFYEAGGMLDLTRYNGDASLELPLAVSYVIGKDGIVSYAFLDADYRKRAETTELLAAIKQLHGKQ